MACYDEYGNQSTDLNQTAVDAEGDPIDSTTKLNTGALSYGWLGTKQRATDGSGLVLMGARLYNPATGLFTSVDPAAGGNSTAYAYPQDPINWSDLDGNMAAAALIAVALPGLAVGEVIAILGVAVLTTLALYAIWHGRHAAAQKLQVLWAKAGKKSGKEKANDVPEYATGQKWHPGESLEQAIKRVMGPRYPKTAGDRRKNKEYSEIKKYLGRNEGW